MGKLLKWAAQLVIRVGNQNGLVCRTFWQWLIDNGSYKAEKHRNPAKELLEIYNPKKSRS